MKIKGTVQEDVVHELDTSIYTLRNHEKTYIIVSKGRQAIKDYIFVKKDQKMEIEGEEIDHFFRSDRSTIQLGGTDNEN